MSQSNHLESTIDPALLNTGNATYGELLQRNSFGSFGSTDFDFDFNDFDTEDLTLGHSDWSARLEQVPQETHPSGTWPDVPCTASPSNFLGSGPNCDAGGPGVESDVSWSKEDEDNNLYPTVKNQIRELLWNADRDSIVTQPLELKQRHAIHCMAFLKGLDSKSTGVGQGEEKRSLRISKKRSERSLASAAAPPIDPRRPQSVARDFKADLHGETRSRKRRKEGHFGCHEDGCTKTFDRACDLRKHQKAHDPVEKSLWPCQHQGCDRAFRYPKDARRHAEVHARRGGGIARPAVTVVPRPQDATSSVSGTCHTPISGRSAVRGSKLRKTTVHHDHLAADESPEPSVLDLVKGFAAMWA